MRPQPDATPSGFIASPSLAVAVGPWRKEPDSEATPSASVVWNLHRGVSVLHAPTRYRRHEALRQFREQFERSPQPEPPRPELARSEGVPAPEPDRAGNAAPYTRRYPPGSEWPPTAHSPARSVA